MVKKHNILYEKGEFFITRNERCGYDIWENTLCYAKRRAIFGSDTEEYFKKAKQWIDDKVKIEQK